MKTISASSRSASAGIPGMASLLLFLVGLIVADVVLLSVNLAVGIAYSLLIPAAFLVTMSTYCRKCPLAANRSCRHVILGRITKTLFGTTAPSPYSRFETIGAIAPLAFLILFPLYWLLRALWPLIAFGVLMAAAGLMVVFGVCPGCGNTYCKAHLKSGKRGIR